MSLMPGKGTNKSFPDAASSPSPAKKPLLALTMGDPCGIGPEVILRALIDERVQAAARVLVVGDEARLRRTAKEQRIRWPFGAVHRAFPDGQRWGKPKLLDLANVQSDLLPGQLSAQAGKAAGAFIEQAVMLASKRLADGIVTAPIHKEALSLGGYSDPGHTEMLARLTGSRQVGMMFWAKELSVGLLTTHLALRDAIRKVRKKAVLDKLRLFNREWQKLFGSRPRLAVAALNPHAGEEGRFGMEEAREIQPAVEQARDEGLHVSGPVPADSVFNRARDGLYDLVVCMYHDQATIPVKLLARNTAVNVTVGLPFVRTSVDHGTAMDIAGKGQASPESLIQAVLLAARLAPMRQRQPAATARKASPGAG
jgi:4-hydroxythreonine-4-phosphate dehydrogenase